MLNIRDDRQLRSLTGVSEEVLAELEPVFAEVYEEEQQRKYELLQAQGKRQRKPGGGRKGALATMLAKLCFILYYLKTYPTFDVLAEKFALSRSNAHANVDKFMPLLAQTLAYLGYLPQRHFAEVAELKAACEGIEALLVDVTERQCQRPQENELQKAHYSGKKGYHTIKNTVMASPEKLVIFIGQTFAGRNHDYRMLKTEFPPDYPWFEDIRLRLDLGYQGIKSDYRGADIEIPHKKPRKSKKNANPQLSDEEKAYNRALSRTRIYVENAICGMKRFRILVDAFRNRLEAFADDVIAICAGLWNALIS